MTWRPEGTFVQPSGRPAVRVLFASQRAFQSKPPGRPQRRSSRGGRPVERPVGAPIPAGIVRIAVRIKQTVARRTNGRWNALRFCSSAIGPKAKRTNGEAVGKHKRTGKFRSRRSSGVFADRWRKWPFNRSEFNSDIPEPSGRSAVRANDFELNRRQIRRRSLERREIKQTETAIKL